MNRLDKAMVYWMILQFCSVFAENTEQWTEVDNIKGADKDTWFEVTSNTKWSKWYNEYIGICFAFVEIPEIRRSCAKMLEICFAEVCDNAKK